MKNDRIRENLDLCLQEVQVSGALHNEIINRATVPAPVRRLVMPRRMIAAVIAVLLMLGTAAAITVAELVRQEMEPVKQMEMDGQSGAWNQEEKLAIINLMLDWGFDLDREKLDRLNDDLPQEEAELLTYEIIWDCIGERLKAYWRAQGIPTDQPEEFPLASDYALYEALWLMNDPGADPVTIGASYEEWAARIQAQTPMPTEMHVPTKKVVGQDYAALVKTIDGYMADVMSMSTRERNAATWTAELNEAGTAWQVNISVKGSLLREETREWFHRQYLIGNTAYDQETDYYDYPYVFTAEGRSGDAATLEEYEWNNLIPREAWPEMPDAYADYPYFDPLKCFLYASAAEKAAFSQAWKPVVDAWLEEHPAYKDKLLAEGSNNYLYRITRHHYGTPPEKYIQQHEALRIAVMHSITLRPDVTVDQLMNRCHHILYYDLCDPDRPLWKVEVSWDAERMLSGDPVVDFLVIIDPRSGEVISDQRTLTLEDALRW